MFFDRAVLLDVFPEKYYTDAYDIVNIFYNGVINRCSRKSGAAEPARIIASPEVLGEDYISVSCAENGFSIDIHFYARGGHFPDSGDGAPENRVCKSGNGTRAKAGAAYIEGKPIAYSFKISLYHLLKTQARSERQITQSLPWGALVGVRPIKLYVDQLEKGISQPAIIEDMARIYDVPEKTSALCLRIATAQIPVLNAYNHANDCILYIGVPFCVSKCAYCSFPSDAHNKIEIYERSYMDALLNEIGFIADHLNEEKRGIKAIYIGGGTPTALSARELERLIGGIRDFFTRDYPDEITVEAGRADTITREKLAIIHKAARIVNRFRLCINPQTMNDRTLRLIGRAHSPEDVVKAFWLARDMGFDDINMDIIAGLPGEDKNAFAETLEAISFLKPESLTSHTLCIKRSSRFNEFDDEYIYPDAEETGEMQEAARVFAARMGMAPYYLYRQKNTIGNLANVGYAVKGCECAYNIHEMADRIDVYAAGAGAVSKFVCAGTGSVERVFNVKNLLEYISRNDEMIERKRRYLTLRRKE